ncbi:MAG: cytochrome c1 [Pseudomonadota bacterium]
MALLVTAFGLVAGLASAADEVIDVPSQNWSFDGLFGTFDRAATQRGLQVYQEVCASCHALDYVAFRHLEQIGFTPAEVKSIAAGYIITDGPNDEGEMFDRAGVPADFFPAPYANEQQGRSVNNGAWPPNLSLMTRARSGGADYLYALLNGYEDPPAGTEVSEGMAYNAYYSGHMIAMAAPLIDGQVSYNDETEATAQQMAWDVVTFLSWAADPHMEARKQMGIKVIIFLLALVAVMYMVKRQVWSEED